MTVLPEILNCREFVNADEIAKGLSPFNPQEVAIEAGKIMLQRIDSLLHRKVSFAIETTLATRSYKNLIEHAKHIGYEVFLLFFWLPSPLQAEQRVAMRVASGGHDIPKEVIHRRYYLGIQNLFDIFVPIVDHWALYDNSVGFEPVVEGNIIRDIDKLNKIKEQCRHKKK